MNKNIAHIRHEKQPVNGDNRRCARLYRTTCKVIKDTPRRCRKHTIKKGGMHVKPVRPFRSPASRRNVQDVTQIPSSSSSSSSSDIMLVTPPDDASPQSTKSSESLGKPSMVYTVEVYTRDSKRQRLNHEKEYYTEGGCSSHNTSMYYTEHESGKTRPLKLHEVNESEVINDGVHRRREVLPGKCIVKIPAERRRGDKVFTRRKSQHERSRPSPMLLRLIRKIEKSSSRRNLRLRKATEEMESYNVGKKRRALGREGPLLSPSSKTSREKSTDYVFETPEHLLRVVATSLESTSLQILANIKDGKDGKDGEKSVSKHDDEVRTLIKKLHTLKNTVYGPDDHTLIHALLSEKYGILVSSLVGLVQKTLIVRNTTNDWGSRTRNYRKSLNSSTLTNIDWIITNLRTIEKSIAGYMNRTREKALDPQKFRKVRKRFEEIREVIRQ